MPGWESSLSGQRVLVTGHTGFTGGWACAWLAQIGAEVCGVSLPPETSPNLFQVNRLADTVASHEVDIRQYEALLEVFEAFRPTVVLHLAAQALVRRAYRQPLETFDTNVMGTANVLEAARTTPGVRAVVCITTDKVYRNQDWTYPYRETDPLGGKDPYSASKSAAELVTDSFIRTLSEMGNGVRIVTARGGNILGGGDWSEDRIVPDFMRAYAEGRPLVIRNPNALRPWQHVLALVHGYLQLAAALLDGTPLASTAWNFGPRGEGTWPVSRVIATLAGHLGEVEVRYESSAAPEAQLLQLDSSLARSALGWQVPWSTAETLARVAQWYQAFYKDPASAPAMTAEQLASYRNQLAAAASSG